MYLVFTRMPGEEDVPLVEFMYLVFTRMPGESNRRSLLLYLCYVLQALINSLVCLILLLYVTLPSTMAKRKRKKRRRKTQQKHKQKSNLNNETNVTHIQHPHYTYEEMQLFSTIIVFNKTSLLDTTQLKT